MFLLPILAARGLAIAQAWLLASQIPSRRGERRRTVTGHGVTVTVTPIYNVLGRVLAAGAEHLAESRNEGLVHNSEMPK